MHIGDVAITADLQDVDRCQEPLADFGDFKMAYLREASRYVQTDPTARWGSYHVSQSQELDVMLSHFNYRKHTSYVIISGPLGGGKTTIMRSLSQMLRHTPAYFDVIGADILVEEFNNHGSRMMPRLRRSMLAINDYGVVDDKGQHYAYRASPIDQLVFSRHERGLVTFFTTNLNSKDFFEKWSQRTRDRIESNYKWITWTPGHNYRRPREI